ncbi:carbohydrate kinase [Trichocladium antarcticum]|uniref:Gluconokinase n=1 Tax=Trichocladium antarcticum TaxID=1450529 RepID=A0AAN6UF85_9PEZI|nr:carbohydrate kinase [Trichocladium antarcticum]
MLSFNTPLPMGGQLPPSSGVMSTGRQSIPPSPKNRRLGTSGLSNGATSTNGFPAEQHHIWLVTGPAGCGKSTVAKHLSDCLNLPYIEGDEYHPQANIDKMSAGIPLTDADRWDWLTALREASIRELDRGSNGVVLTCSALKRKYRDVIRVAPYFSPNLHVHFIYLDASEELLLKRVKARKNHYMGANMVHSQFDILERPTAAEIDVLTVDVDRSLEEVKTAALDSVLRTMEDIRADGRA